MRCKSGIITIILVLAASGAGAFECNECHSKKPSMVKMHLAVRGQGCFGCHKVGDKLMGKGQPKDMDSLIKRRISDENCVQCHAVKQKER